MFEKKGKLAVILGEKVSRIIVFGDIHGDYESLGRGLSLFDSQDLIIFLGDYADRGPDGVEVIDEVQELVKKYPDQVIALKGNHEDYSEWGSPKFAPCTLIQEAEEKRKSWEEYFKNTLQEFLNKLYLAAILPGKALFVHGGITQAIQSDTDLTNSDYNIIQDVLWSDPGNTFGERFSFRGIGRVFGPDVSKSVLQKLGVNYLIRSHEPRKALLGPVVEHENTVITLSSTQVYGGQPFILSLNTQDFPDTKQGIQDSIVYL